MAFDSKTGKEAGKKSKRTTDKQLKELREVYSNILETNTDNIQKWFNEVAKDNPAKALELMLKMGSYIIPKPRSIEIKLKEDEQKENMDFSNWSNEDLNILIELGRRQKEIEAKYK